MPFWIAHTSLLHQKEGVCQQAADRFFFVGIGQGCVSGGGTGVIERIKYLNLNKFLMKLSVTHQQGGMREFERTGIYLEYLIFNLPSTRHSWKTRII